MLNCRENDSVYNFVTPARFYAHADTSYGPVSVSVTSRSFVELTGWIELVFGLEACFNQSFTVF